MRGGLYCKQIPSLLLRSVLMGIPSSCLPPFPPIPQNTHSTLCLASINMFPLPLPLSLLASGYLCAHQKSPRATAGSFSVMHHVSCPAQPPVSQCSVTWLEFLWRARHKNTPLLSITKQPAWFLNSWLLLFEARWVMLQHATAM